MIDNKGKLFGKINIIDLGVICIIILAAVLGMIKFNLNPINDTTVETVSFQYDLKVSGVRTYTVDAFKEGDIIYDGTSENPIGEIININVEPTKKYTSDINGVMKKETVPTQYDLILTLKCDGKKDLAGLKTSTGEQIQLNKWIYAYNKYCKTNFEIKNIK